MSSDDYQRKYMSEGGLVYQSKARAPLLFHLLVLSPLLISLPIVAVAATEAGASPWTWLTLLPSLGISLIIWLLFTVLRATVTKSHVHVQYGLFGPKIPLERIESCEAVSYDWKKYGGFGIRRGSDGSWAYNMMGDQGRAVKLVWRDEIGDVVTTLLSSPDPEGFAAAVGRARAKPGARLDVDPEALMGRPLAEAERELEAELEEAASADATAEERRGAR